MHVNEYIHFNWFSAKILRNSVVEYNQSTLFKNNAELGMMSRMNNKKQTIQKHIVDKYGKIALNRTSCCDSGSSRCCSNSEQDTIALSMQIGYSNQEISDVPNGSNLNLGCGNPQTFAELKQGEVILDLGSGAGFDSFLAARQVGDQGKVLGIDMTPAMVRKAKNYANSSSYKNTFFQLGQIEHLPIKSNGVDVIISNCVINLSTDKDQVFREAYRVLKPGGRLAVSDVIALTELPEEIKNDLELYSDCFSGALEHNKLTILLKAVGFSEISIDFDNKGQDVTQSWSLKYDPVDYIRSASIRAVKTI